MVQIYFVVMVIHYAMKMTKICSSATRRLCDTDIKTSMDIECWYWPVKKCNCLKNDRNSYQLLQNCGYAFSIVTFTPATSQLLREIYNVTFVLDVDECSLNSHSCDVNAVCNNTLGSHNCKCKAGYSGDGKSCSGESNWKTSLTTREHGQRRS